ncbi:MAG: ArgR family transcriptional regulator [Prolixibacteraceae bacterium]|nr:ArgR family transcriptional regulator [Prolixibacteraceae bacterium]
MKNRVVRHAEIRKIISRGNIRSQDELLAELKTKGYDLTQATLSRDLKFLQVAKVAHPLKGYIYVISESEKDKKNSVLSSDSFLADGFRGLQFSGSIAVMKTLPGYASGIAAVLDSANQYEILGTIAGDDTILIVRRENTTQNDLLNALVSIMPKLKNKLEE